MLSYETKGKGLPLVLIHAFPLSRKMWTAASANLIDEFKIILPDLPGFGDSARQAKPSIPDMAREVAALLDRLKITEPVWMGGLSMGGYVLFEFLRQFPKRVRGLGLFATRATADTPEARENRLRAIEAIEKCGMEPYAEKIVKSQLGKTTLEKNPEILRTAWDIMRSQAREGAMDALKAMAQRRDSSDLLGAIRVPTLIMAGSEDTIVPEAEMEAMHRQISGSEFYAIPQSGHLVNLEQPGPFHRILKNFLDRQKVPGSSGASRNQVPGRA